MSTDTSNSGNENTATQQQAGNENTSTQTDGQAQVTMGQEDLNNLINSKFAKGADKATNDLLVSLGVENVDALKSVIADKKAQDEASKTELEKMVEQLEASKTENANLLKLQNETNRTATINKLALENGVAELDYFTFEYSKNSGAEDFKVEDFITKLKENKPFVFGQKATAPKADTTSNNGGKPAEFNDRVKQAKSRKELDALYREL